MAHDILPPAGDPPRTRGSDAQLILDLLRHIRRLCAHTALARQHRAASREALEVAVAMLADKDAELDRARATSQSLRDELRRYTAAQTGRP